MLLNSGILDESENEVLVLPGTSHFESRLATVWLSHNPKSSKIGRVSVISPRSPVILEYVKRLHWHSGTKPCLVCIKGPRWEMNREVDVDLVERTTTHTTQELDDRSSILPSLSSSPRLYQ